MNTNLTSPSSTHLSRPEWAKFLVLSLFLLATYLGFFHMCIGASPWTCIGLGVTFWAVWVLACFFWRNIFVNRFEYVVHQLVGLDIVIEGVNPFHEGFGFYFCALGFWGVFWIYRAFWAYNHSSTSDLSQLRVPSGSSS